MRYSFKVVIGDFFFRYFQHKIQVMITKPLFDPVKLANLDKVVTRIHPSIPVALSDL